MNKRSRQIALMTLLGALLGTAAMAGELTVKMTVKEPVGVARRAEPISGGIPLPRQTFKKGQEFAVFQGGRQVPAQVLPMVVDEKGFVHWVLVDLQADVAANGKQDFVLRAVKGSAKPTTPIKVVEDGDGVSVETGRIKFTVSKSKPFSLFTTVTAGGKPVVGGGEVSYTDAWGEKKKYVADKPTSVEVEYNGPMRATVCVRGRFVGDEKSKLRYIARITAWAGKSRVHVKYKLSNSNSEHYCYRQIKDSSIALKLAAKPSGTILGAGKPMPGKADGWLYSGLNARANGAAKAGSGAEASWTSQGKADVAQGWIAAKVGGATVYACDTYFVDDPPRKLAVVGGSLVLTGSTARFEGGGKGSMPFAAKHRVLFDCSHISSEYLLDFAAPGDGNQLQGFAKGARGWLHLMAEPSWYFETESLAVGRFGTQADELKAYDTWKWSYAKGQAPKVPGRRTFFRRFVLWEDNHFETEQDCVEALLLMYLRTGYRSFFEATQAWANYNMDRQLWRTDGWKWKDGGVWKRSGPLGNKPQRGKDPVTGQRNYCPGGKNTMLEPGAAGDFYKMSIGSQCKCHNYASGMAAWYCLTGDRDALEAAVDSVEQQYDTQKRAFRKVPGKTNKFSRDFTRSVYLTNAVRLAAPTDPSVVEASDYLTAVYLKRTVKEPRGLVTGSVPLTTSGFYRYSKSGTPREYVGTRGMEEMQKLGIEYNKKDGQLTDPKTGVKWYPIPKPNSFMLPSISCGVESYYRVSGNEDAHDWVIAFGKGLAYVIFQKDHKQQHGSMLTDFPKKGIVRDLASWSLPAGSENGKGIKISGYLSRFYPDVCARAYTFCGEPFLKQRAYDYWNHGSHRGYWAKETRGLGKVAQWVNVYGVHSESVCFTGRTFYEWAHPRRDAKPPAAVKDLKVTVAGGKATVSFSAPADVGGGKVVRYQVKCSDKPIVSYEEYLKLFNNAKDEEKAKCNWWLAANLGGEPAPKAPGAKESFTVSGVPAGAKFFAVRAFDDSRNRSALSNVAQ